MPTELIDPIAALLIFAFVIGRGIGLLRQWFLLNAFEKDNPTIFVPAPRLDCVTCEYNKDCS